MKKELEYFYIKDSYGWNQDWFKEVWMNIGGCGCVTACDTFVHLKKYKNKNNLYPFDTDVVEKEEYFKFTNIIKPYLRPRWTGIDKLDLYIEGVKKYFLKIDENTIDVSGFSGDNSYEAAKNIIKKQIENGYVIPMLILKHKNHIMKDYVWHWFLINGYEEIDNKFKVKLVTYGKYEWKDLEDVWNTGYTKKGGLIIYSEK